MTLDAPLALTVLAAAGARFGSGLLQVAIPWMILSETGNASIAVGILSLQMLPAVFSPLFGKIIDRGVSKNHLLALVGLQSACVCGIPLFVLLGSSSATAVLLIGLGSATTMLAILNEFIFVPSVSRRSDVERNYGSYLSVANVALALAPIVAGITISFLGVYSTFVAATFFYAVSGYLNYLVLDQLDTKTSGATHEEKDHTTTSLASSLKLILDAPNLRGLMLSQFIYNLGMGGIVALLVVRVSGSDMETAVSSGAMISFGAICGAIGAWINKYFAVGTDITSRIVIIKWFGLIGVLGLFSPSVSLAAFAGFGLLSLCQAAANTSTLAMRSLIIAPHLRGRTNGLLRMFALGSAAISPVLHATIIGVTDDLFYSTLLIFVCALLSVLVFQMSRVPIANPEMS